MNAARQDNVAKYLTRYAESEAAIASTLFSSDDYFQQVLCLPAYDETVDDIQSILQFAKQCHNTLVVLVINEPANNGTANESSGNGALCYQRVRERYVATTSNQHLSRHLLCTSNSGSEVLLIDRFSDRLKIPCDQGVGLARKIAADIACMLIHRGIVKSPFIYNTDIDVVLPIDYFDAAKHILDTDKMAADHVNNLAALVYAFEHICDKTTDRSGDIFRMTAMYEQRLNAYVSGLARARSPYAFHTIGSTIAIHYQHYASVRGFPKRAAGEDFYLLNKLRKSGEIKSLTNPIIKIRSRTSTRTPFGTGRAVNDLLRATPCSQKKNGSDEQDIFYHPKVFVLLEYLLKWFDHLSSDLEAILATNQEHVKKTEIANGYWQLHLSTFFAEPDDDSIENLLCDSDQQLILRTLEAIRFNDCFTHCLKQCKNSIQLHKQLHYWFDAFRTLKWIHTVRDLDCRYRNISQERYQTLKRLDVIETTTSES